MTLPSKARAPTIWMNVTTSAHWTRAAVGIVRVERELSRELAKLYGSDDFKLCTYQHGEFIPYYIDLNHPNPKPAPQQPATPATSRRFPKSSTFESTFGWLRSANSSGTLSLRSQRLTKLFSTKHHQASLEKIADPKQEIEFGDIIVSVGLDWDHIYTNDFYRINIERGLKIVTCCYDLIPVLFPQYCVGSVASRFKDYFTKLSWSSSLVLCISERSRQDYLDLMRNIGAPEADTLVVPLGDHIPDSANDPDIEVEDGPSPEVARAAEKPFILFVSTIERRKNHEVLYRAYHLLARSGHADRLPRLIFVGMPGWGVDDLLKDIEFDPLTRDLIIQLNHVSDRDLAGLYQKAYFCVFPSLYEGWGLPVGEALACGKAVIASTEGSIPEVGGDLVTYLDPWNPKAWAEEILALVDHPDRVKAMETAVKERYKPRTWLDTARVVKSGLDKLRIAEPVSIALLPGHQLATKAGVAWGEGIRSKGLAGLLTRGPSHWLPPGAYEVKIHLDEFAGERGYIVIAFRSLGGKREHARSKISLSGKDYHGQIHSFSVTLAEQLKDYEIFSEITSGVYISMNRIEIREMDPNPSTEVR